MTESNKRLAESWKNRIHIRIPAAQFKRIAKGLKGKVVVNYQWYTMERCPDISDVELFDKDGKKLTTKQLKKLLRGA